MLDLARVNPNLEDKMILEPSYTLQYTVKSEYNLLEEAGQTRFAHRVIWNNIYLHKVNFFLWLVYHRKILTIDNLQRRGRPTLRNRLALARGKGTYEFSIIKRETCHT